MAMGLVMRGLHQDEATISQWSLAKLFTYAEMAAGFLGIQDPFKTTVKHFPPAPALRARVSWRHES